MHAEDTEEHDDKLRCFRDKFLGSFTAMLSLGGRNKRGLVVYNTGSRGAHTESQNVGGWKGPLGIRQSNPLSKQGHPEQAA